MEKLYLIVIIKETEQLYVDMRVKEIPADIVSRQIIALATTLVNAINIAGHNS